VKISSWDIALNFLETQGSQDGDCYLLERVTA